MVWGSCGKTLRDKLQRLQLPQNRAARILTYSNFDADASILLNELGWKNLETQRLINKAVMVYKSLYCLAPDYLSSKFIQRSNIFKDLVFPIMLHGFLLLSLLARVRGF